MTGLCISPYLQIPFVFQTVAALVADTVRPARDGMAATSAGLSSFMHRAIFLRILMTRLSFAFRASLLAQLLFSVLIPFVESLEVEVHQLLSERGLNGLLGRLLFH